jgi:phosphoglycerol transferase MdoB-like AlkP superfamily enzyme
MEFLILGIVVAFNMIVIYVKIRAKRFLDALLDFLMLLILSLVFGGTYSGLVVATVASFIISIYLFINPPKIDLSSFKPP